MGQKLSVLYGELIQMVCITHGNCVCQKRDLMDGRFFSIVRLNGGSFWKCVTVTRQASGDTDG